MSFRSSAAVPGRPEKEELFAEKKWVLEAEEGHSSGSCALCSPRDSRASTQYSAEPGRIGARGSPESPRAVHDGVVNGTNR